MFLTGAYFFIFKQIRKQMDSFKELSFFLMLIRTIIETGLFVVFRSRYLNKIVLLSVIWKEMFKGIQKKVSW